MSSNNSSLLLDGRWIQYNICFMCKISMAWITNSWVWPPAGCCCCLSKWWQCFIWNSNDGNVVMFHRTRIIVLMISAWFGYRCYFCQFCAKNTSKSEVWLKSVVFDNLGIDIRFKYPTNYYWCSSWNKPKLCNVKDVIHLAPPQHISTGDNHPLITTAENGYKWKRCPIIDIPVRWRIPRMVTPKGQPHKYLFWKGPGSDYGFCPWDWSTRYCSTQGATIALRSAVPIPINFWQMVGLYISFGRLSQCTWVLKVSVLETGLTQYCSISGNDPLRQSSSLIWALSLNFNNQPSSGRFYSQLVSVHSAFLFSGS